MPPYPFLHSGISIDPKTLDWEEGGEANRGSFTEIDGRDHSIVYYNRKLKERLQDVKLCKNFKIDYRRRSDGESNRT